MLSFPLIGSLRQMRERDEHIVSINSDNPDVAPVRMDTVWLDENEDTPRNEMSGYKVKRLNVTRRASGLFLGQCSSKSSFYGGVRKSTTPRARQNGASSVIFLVNSLMIDAHAHVRS